jgi:hypothetical protein
VNCGDNARPIVLKPAAHADVRASGNKFFFKILPARIECFFFRHNGAQF